MQQYSEFVSYPGWDRTYIERISFEEFERRVRNAKPLQLKSSNPNVTFNLEYPLWKDGREVCYMDQLLDARIEQEFQRQKEEKAGAQRGAAVQDEVDGSGLRISEELSEVSEESAPIERSRRQDDAEEGDDAVPRYRPTPYIRIAEIEEEASEILDCRPSSGCADATPPEARSTTLSEVTEASGTVSTLQCAQPEQRISFSIYRDSTARKSIVKRPTSASATQPPPIVPALPQQQPPMQSLPQQREVLGAKVTVVQIPHANPVSLPPQPPTTQEPQRDTAANLFRLTSRDTVLRPTVQLFGRNTQQLHVSSEPKYTPIHVDYLASKLIDLNAQNAALECNYRANVPPAAFTEHVVSDRPAPPIVSNSVLDLGLGFDSYFVECEVTSGSGVFAAHGGGNPDAPAYLYAWGTTTQNESLRAALCLQFCCPAATVCGFRFMDGGITVIHPPAPLSSLQRISERACEEPAMTAAVLTKFAVTVLAELFVAKRCIHGDLHLSNLLVSMNECGAGVFVPTKCDRFLDLRVFDLPSVLSGSVHFSSVNIPGSSPCDLSIQADVASLLGDCISRFGPHLAPTVVFELQELLEACHDPTVNLSNTLIRLRRCQKLIRLDSTMVRRVLVGKC